MRKEGQTRWKCVFCCTAKTTNFSGGGGGGGAGGGRGDVTFTGSVKSYQCTAMHEKNSLHASWVECIWFEFDITVPKHARKTTGLLC